MIAGTAWGYRLRLKGNRALDVDCTDVSNTEDFVRRVAQTCSVGACSSPGSSPIAACRTRQGIPSRPWIVTMDPAPSAIVTAARTHALAL